MLMSVEEDESDVLKCNSGDNIIVIDKITREDGSEVELWED